LVDHWSNLLLGVLGNFLEIKPIFVDFGESLDLRIFGNLGGLESLESFFKLINLKSDDVSFVLGFLNR
jgi:hypothetical protein